MLKLVMIRMIVALSDKKIYDETKLEITMDNQKDIFKATGRMIVDEGWTQVEQVLTGRTGAANTQQADEQKDDKDEDDQQIFTDIALNQRVHLDKVNIIEKKTTPPKPYTEATLLTAMEKASREIDDKDLKESMKGKGLGTPATRAAIIEKLINVGYVERRKKNLHPTQQGTMFISLVPESIRQVEMTAQWEMELQEICDGKGNPEQFMQDIRRYVTQTVTENNVADTVQAVSRKGTLRRVVGKCPKCGQNVIESDKSFYCDGFRMEHKCNFSLWKNNKYLQARGVTLTAELAQELLTNGKMQVNNLTSKAGNSYNAIFYMDPGEQYVNFRMEFAPRQNTPQANQINPINAGQPSSNQERDKR